MVFDGEPLALSAFGLDPVCATQPCNAVLAAGMPRVLSSSHVFTLP